MKPNTLDAKILIGSAQKKIANLKVKKAPPTEVKDIRAALRSSLDYVYKETLKTLGYNVKLETFPILDEQKKFADYKAKNGMSYIENKNSKIYAYILNLQPFSSPQNQWIKVLNETRNESEHEKLPLCGIERKDALFRGGFHIGNVLSMGENVRIDANDVRIGNTSNLNPTCEIQGKSVTNILSGDNKTKYIYDEKVVADLETALQKIDEIVDTIHNLCE